MKPFCLLCSSLSFLLVASCQTAPEKKTDSPLAEKPAPAAPSVSASSPDALGKITTPSGLQYKVLASGPADGRSPTRSDSVTVHYRGTLTDGTVFDSSIERGTPATFGVSQVIPGWTEALQLMKPGDEWVLFIPARLAYGNRAMGDKIPANSDLVFQVRLLQVTSGGGI